jgi:arginyl-tRNA synthetase
MAEGKILYYKDYPLVRQGNLIYYGNITDKYIIMMQVLETKKLKDLDLASKVSIQLQYTDPDISSKNRIVKKSEKKGLYEAMDLAYIWLTRALNS